MVTLDELNLLRQHEKWDEVLVKSREHVTNDPSCSYALRALVQALEKEGKKDSEYEAALQRLLDIKDRVIETSVKLAQFYRDANQRMEAIRYYELSLDTATSERQYDQIDSAWMELIEIAPDHISFFINIADRLHEIKHHQRAASLLQMVLPSTEEREDWQGRHSILKKIFEYTPKDESLRDLFIDTFTSMYSGSPHFDEILSFSKIKDNRSLEDALEEVETFAQFMPDSFVEHADWGVGRVKDLNMLRNKVTINFQRKRNHQMDISLAKNIVERLSKEDFRVILVTRKDELIGLVKDNPNELIKILLKSFGGSLSAKEIKEKLCPAVVGNKEWSTWWSKTSSALRRDEYIAVSGGASKVYTVNERATSDEEQLMNRFDEIKVPRDKVDLVYEYLRTTKRADMDEKLLQHFSQKMLILVPKRSSATEKVELYYANEDLKTYSNRIESFPEEILISALEDIPKAVRIIKRLRFKSHEMKFIDQFHQYHPEIWHETFREILIEEDVQVRDEVSEYLIRSDRMEYVTTVVDTVLAEYRKYPQAFIWLARKSLLGEMDWLAGKISPSHVLERLLILTDYLTSQAKRRERDESNWLRKVAGDAREIIRRNHYILFKKHIQGADESVAQAIYRRCHTNEGLDGRTSADLTTIIRGRFPTLFETHSEEESLIPEGLQCLKESLMVKQTYLKRLIEVELPHVVKEIETARGHGDLKENAEYHAAKDKQKLLASQTAELQDMMQQARGVEMDEITTDKIGFGVQFTIKPVGGENEELYLMLGPWESDPDNNVLSYQAPFAACFLGKEVGETVDVELPRHTGRYEVMAIERLTQEQLNTIIQRIQVAESDAADMAATINSDIRRIEPSHTVSNYHNNEVSVHDSSKSDS
jgi:transcription elongation factor GreA